MGCRGLHAPAFLDCGRKWSDSLAMRRQWPRRIRWLLVSSTALGCFATLCAWRMVALSRPVSALDLGGLLTINMAYWLVPAALAIPISLLTKSILRSAIDTSRAFLIHACAASVFSIIEATAVFLIRWTLFQHGAHPTMWHSAQLYYFSNLDLFVMTYAVIVAFTLASESHRRALEAVRFEAVLAETQLKGLEARLEPHFLFNTLNAISALVYTKPASADRMISRLSNLLRLAFTPPQTSCVSLQQESDYLLMYLEIEQMRFSDRLSVRWEIQPDTLDAEVPRMLLQPLVENAIKHGLSQKNQPGTIEIAARREQNVLCLEIRDDGVGIQGRDDLRPRSSLAITRERLQSLYGEAYNLDLDSRSMGLTVRVTIPFRRVPRAADSPLVTGEAPA
jgi:two-component system LytT family sensor kinase